MTARTFEFDDGTSRKFWRIRLDGSSHTVTYGRIGNSGQTKTKEFATDEKATASHDKLIAEKLAKGYVETGTGKKPAKKAAKKSAGGKAVRSASAASTGKSASKKAKKKAKPGGRFGFLTDDELLAPLLHRLTPMTAATVRKLKKEYPGLPDDYIEFVTTLGTGAIGDAVWLGPWPQAAEEIWGKGNADAVLDVVFVGGDFGEGVLGFDTSNKWKFVDVDSHSRHKYGEKSFTHYLKEQAVNLRQWEIENQEREEEKAAKKNSKANKKARKEKPAKAKSTASKSTASKSKATKNSAASAAPTGAGGPREFELVAGSTRKFWRIERSGSSHTVTYGRIGTSGQTKTKAFASDEKAQAAADKLIAEKLAKGYVETTGTEATGPDDGRRPDLARAFTDGESFTPLKANGKPDKPMVIETVDAGKLKLPTGEIVVADPLMMAVGPPLERTVKPGTYPVIIARITEGSGKRASKTNVAAMVRFRKAQPASWEMAEFGPGFTKTGLRKKSTPKRPALKPTQIRGYGVDAGTGSFMDESVGAKLRAAWREWCNGDYTGLEEPAPATMMTNEMLAAHKNRRTWIDVQPFAEVNANLIAMTSGHGDGVYASWWGLDTAGQPVCLVTDYAVLPTVAAERGDG